MCIFTIGCLKNVMNHSTPIWMIWMFSFIPQKNRGCWACGSWGVVCISTLGVQKSMFKIIMRSNAKATLSCPNVINPLMKMWSIIFHFTILSCSISEYVKLATIQVLGLVEDEWVFNNLNFIKIKIRNQLINNLAFYVHMFGQSILQCVIFLMMKLWGFDNQRNVNMPWMLKGFLIVGCLMQTKPCVVSFSLATLWFYCFCWFVGYLICCYMWMGNTIFMDLLAFCFHDSHWFNNHSLPSS